jgi:hypothetical protein
MHQLVSCPIFPFILIAKNLLTGSLKNRSIDNLETQKKSISMKNSQFFDYLLYAKSHSLPLEGLRPLLLAFQSVDSERT